MLQETLAVEVRGGYDACLKHGGDACYSLFQGVLWIRPPGVIYPRPLFTPSAGAPSSGMVYHVKGCPPSVEEIIEVVETGRRIWYGYLTEGVFSGQGHAIH